MRCGRGTVFQQHGRPFVIDHQQVGAAVAVEVARGGAASHDRPGDFLIEHRHEIDETLQRLRDEQMARQWLITSSGQSASSDGQPTVSAQFVWIEPDVAAWAATVPDGLLDLDIWLTPIR